MSPAAAALAAAALAHAIDGIEHLFGATRVHAIAGNGRLTACLSRQGELTVLRWPNPTFHEHVNHQTSNAKDAREQPRFGARENEGSFAGLSIDGGPVTWLRDAPWTQAQRYASDRDQTVVTEYRNDEIGATVTGIDVVPPDLDVLARRFEVRFDEAPASARLLYFENFSPAVEHARFLPTDQSGLDGERDYLALCAAEPGHVIHFSIPDRPEDRMAALAAADGAAAIDAAAGAEGAFLAMGGDRPPDAWQCGGDDVDGRDEPDAPEDALSDAADGDLSRDPSARRHATAALSWDLLPAGDEVTVLIGAGATATAAMTAVAEARVAGFDALRAASEADVGAWIDRARLPDSSDPALLAVARRALIAIRTGTDPESGAIVASPSVQPPYNLDWPRDGAFFNLALNVAGYRDIAEAHQLFYTRVQRAKDGQDTIGSAYAPAGSFAMNYYADGTPGGPIPFEIDEVGLTLWSWAQHGHFYGDDAEGLRAYLESVFPAMRLAADLLVFCKDADTGLQCLANEDDNPEETQTLHGATTVWLGLQWAAAAASRIGRTEEAARWQARAGELADAIERAFYREGEGYTEAGLPTPGGAFGARAWHLFPTGFRSYRDRRTAETAAAVARDVRPFFARETDGGAYHAKATLALAVYAQQTGDEALLAEVRGWIDLLARDLPTSTWHYGESYLDADLDGDGEREFDNRVAIPHLWEGALVYLSLMAAYSDTTPLPDWTEAPAEDCACSLSSLPRAGAGVPAAAACLVALSLAVARHAARRHRRRRR